MSEQPRFMILLVLFQAALVIVFLILMVSLLWAHEPYSEIFNFNGVRCCSGHDCLMAADPHEFISQPGGYLLRSTGERVPLRDTGFSPDANWHICRRDDRTIRCLLVPPGGA